MHKSELNPNIRISETNVRLNSLGTEKLMFLTFSIPPKTTCPYATKKCKSCCYGNRGVFAMPKTRQSYLNNYLETLKDSFVTDMIGHIEFQLARKKTQGLKVYFRIHQTGDFYGSTYFEKWKRIAEHFKGNSRIGFQSYTKSIPLINSIECNIQLIFSKMPDTDPAHLERAKVLGMPIYNTVEMKIEEYEAYRVANPTLFYCSGDCETCLSCYEGLNKEVINRMRKNGEPSKYKNEGLNKHWTEEKMIEGRKRWVEANKNKGA